MNARRPSPDPASESYFRIEAGYYDRVFRRGRGVQWFWHRVRFERVEEALPEAAERILDLGCGPGTFLGRSRRRFPFALGVDLAPAQIEYARRTYGRPGLEYEVADVTELDGSARFDAVVAIEVIEHLAPELTAPFLGRIRELLAPGGWLVLTTPNYRSLWPVLERVVSRLGPVDYRAQHINPFTVDRLERELAGAGFEAIECSTFSIAAPFVAAVSGRLAAAADRLERRLGPARAGAEILARARRPAG